ncbi:MAG: transglycosylase domain-containing protein [Bacillota bacterium]|nr:transglycosylase domain-containing protein [Bacillota bacterium]
MRKTDITKLTGEIELNEKEHIKPSVAAKDALKVTWKFLITAFTILLVSGSIVTVSMIIYIFSFADEPTGINLRNEKLNLTSFIYTTDDKGNTKVYQKLYGDQNRVRVDYKDIPQAMKDAIVSIEDKRFWQHHGVDWQRTLGAVLNLSSGSNSYGGSTLTQQLIKNISNDNEVSLNRKIREIFRALNLEKQYSKDEILEAYLNTVPFGNGTCGCQAAANLYFNKNIKDCDIAQCAAIAGITQNPSKYDPLIYPDNNRVRRETVIKAMYDQGKITKAQYDQAMEESKTMTFVGYTIDRSSSQSTNTTQNWYIDALFRDVQRDLSVKLNINEDTAASMLYSEGLKIYSAMDVDTQTYMEKVATSIDKSDDPGLQTGMVLMDFRGRIIATVGSSIKKNGNLLYDRATNSPQQPGSTIKPIIVYPMSLENKSIYYSSTVTDEPMKNYYSDGSAGPVNWYSGYRGSMLVPKAIEWSANCPVVQLMNNSIGTKAAYNQAVSMLGFSHLSAEQDSKNTGALSIGGMTGGVTVREMCAATAYLGSGGRYYAPYTYYYVTDNNDNVILDNRDEIPKQAYSPETATIMNKLLRYNVVNAVNDRYTQAWRAYMGSDWDIIGKTGSTDKYKDSWFIGASPYCCMAVWNGFDSSDTISINGRANSSTSFKKVMEYYLKNKSSKKDYDFAQDVISANYDIYTGKLTTSSGSGTAQGWYTKDNMPPYEYSGYDSSNDNTTSSSSSSSSSTSSTSSTASTSSEGSTSSNSNNNTTSSKTSTSSKPTG